MPGDPWLGSTLSGCVLTRMLGRGGMGAAYAARRQADGVEVVVKLLPPDAGGDERLRARLRREADALRRVKGHPNLVAVLGAEVDGAGPPHLVLELCPGAPLKALIGRHGRLAPADAARVARDVARGLAVLHGHGLLHRDVKPENIVVAPDGRARLIDFGIAKDQFMSVGLTAPGQLIGTAEYMAPEQWTGGAQDARADLFSLGATLYHALTGRPPFVGESLDEIMELCTAGDVEPLRDLAPEAPEALERVVLHLLDPQPRFRYARAERAAQDLEAVLRGEQPPGPPCLEVLDGPARGARHALQPGARFLLGASPRVQVRLEGAAVAPEHAEVRREEGGFTLHDLRAPGGTWVGDQRLTRARLLEDGDVVRLGDVRLRVRDESGRRAPPEWLDDARRAELPDAVVGALARAGDGRAVAALLELLEPDPLVERAAEEALRALAPAQAAALLARRARHAADARAHVPALLAAAAGEALGQDPIAWLSWWFHARGRLPDQVGPARAPRALRLVPSPGDPVALLAMPGEPGVLLAGRDARCHLRVPHPTVSRLHATLVRLHRRLVLRDEGGPSGTRLGDAPVHVAFLDPGHVLGLGDGRVTIEGADVPEPGPDGARVVDAWTFQALDEAGHPATVGGHIAALDAAARAEAWALGVARDLHPSDRVRAGQLARALHDAWQARAARARVALPALLGRDVGGDVGAWRALAGAAGLGGQVVAAGWWLPA